MHAPQYNYLAHLASVGYLGNHLVWAAGSLGEGEAGYRGHLLLAANHLRTLARDALKEADALERLVPDTNDTDPGPAPY